MKKIINLLLFASVLLAVFSCEKDHQNFTEPGHSHEAHEVKTQEHIPPDRTLEIGLQRPNPYSVQNMREAYEKLKARKKIKPIKIETTHYHVRFLPRDEKQRRKLDDPKFDNLILLDFP